MKVFLNKSKFKINKTIFNCKMDYEFDNSVKKKSLKNFSINEEVVSQTI